MEVWFLFCICHKIFINFKVNDDVSISRDPTELFYFYFQCIKELCLLLLNQSLLLPSLKLLVESKDQELHIVALEQITAVAKV